MYIKGSRSTRKLVIRRIGRDILEAPITVEFSSNGVARVKAGVGEVLSDLFPSITIIDEESDTEEDE